MAKKRQKSRRKSRKRKNPTRRCSVCRSAKHDRRKCRSKKKRRKKSKKVRRRRRRNPVANSLATRYNPCETCGCTCKDVETPDIETSAEASRYLRSRLHRRRNPGWSFRQGRAVPHEQKLESLYQRPASRRLGRRSVSPWRRNPCGSRRHRTTRNPDCWMCDDTGYKGNDFCPCPAGQARGGSRLRNPHLTHKYCGRDDR